MSRTFDLGTTIELPSGEEVDVSIDFTVSHWPFAGSGPSWASPGEPPEGPEFELVKITRADNNEEVDYNQLKPEVQQKLEEAACERIYEIDDSRRHDPDE